MSAEAIAALTEFVAICGPFVDSGRSAPRMVAAVAAGRAALAAERRVTGKHPALVIVDDPGEVLTPERIAAVEALLDASACSPEVD